MKTIVFNSQKGGSGKTTLCAHLAVEAERAGYGPVYLIDTDPQGTLTTWHKHRQAEDPKRVEVTLPRLQHGLSQVEALGAAYCLIDTSPTRHQDLATLFGLADLTIVPIRPSAADLWAASETVSDLKSQQRPFLFVLNQVKARSLITAQAAAILSHHGRVAETLVADRVAYAGAFTNGQSAVELDRRGPAAEEMRTLWMNLLSALTTIPARPGDGDLVAMSTVGQQH